MGKAPGLLPKHDTQILAAVQPVVESVHEVVKLGKWSGVRLGHRVLADRHVGPELVRGVIR